MSIQNNDFIAMEKGICRICGKLFNGTSILINQRFKTITKEESITHYGFCKEHQALLDDNYVFCLEIDPNKSLIEDNHVSDKHMHRTGRYAVIKRDVLSDLLNTEITADTPIVAIDSEFLEYLHKLAESATVEE